MTFKDLNITESILKAIEEKGYVNPTPIQAKAIPALLVGNLKSAVKFSTTLK